MTGTAKSNTRYNYEQIRRLSTDTTKVPPAKVLTGYEQVKDGNLEKMANNNRSQK
jgi:hypothetical protein